MTRKATKNYASFTEKKTNRFTGVEKEANQIPRLTPGVYELTNDMHGNVYFSMIDTNHDDLIDLPTSEYDLVIRQIEMFFTPECKLRFKEKGFLFKRSALIFGPPGTGKTCLVNRIADYAVQHDSVVLFNPHPRLIQTALEMLEDIQPDTTVIVIFEELDRLIAEYEGPLLSILDGEVQKNNVVYLATTNYIDQIPPRVRRPGRFSNLVEVNFPTAAVRRYYLDLKLKADFSDAELDLWAKKTEGFSVDELKETVLAVYCLKEKLEDIIARIKFSKGLPVMNLTNGPQDRTGCDDCGSEFCDGDCCPKCLKRPCMCVSEPRTIEFEADKEAAVPTPQFTWSRIPIKD